MTFKSRNWYIMDKSTAEGVVNVGNLKEYLENESVFTADQIESILILAEYYAKELSHTGDVMISARLKNDTELYVSTYNLREYYLEPSNYAITPVQKADGSTKIIESAKSGLVLALGAPALFFGNTHFNLGPAAEGFFTNMHEYCFGALRGHISFCSAGIAIHNVINLIPHNGDFDDFITTMEAFAQEQQVDLAFMYIINRRFAEYLVRRGYSHYAISGMFGLAKSYHKDTSEWNNKRMEALGEAMLRALNEPECAGKKKQLDALMKHAQKEFAAEGIDPSDIRSLKKSGRLDAFAHEANKIMFGTAYAPSSILYGSGKEDEHNDTR